jgi:hypothetical protein
MTLVASNEGSALGRVGPTESPKMHSRDITVQLTCAALLLLLIVVWVLLEMFVR